MKGPGTFPTTPPLPPSDEGYSLGEGAEMLPEGTIVKILDTSDPLFARVKIVETGRQCLIRTCDLRSLSPLSILGDQAE